MKKIIDFGGGMTYKVLKLTVNTWSHGQINKLDMSRAESEENHGINEARALLLLHFVEPSNALQDTFPL